MNFRIPVRPAGLLAGLMVALPLALTPAVQGQSSSTPASTNPASAPASSTADTAKPAAQQPASSPDANTTSPAAADEGGSGKNTADKSSTDPNATLSADKTAESKGCADDPDTGKNPCGAPKGSKQSKDAKTAAASPTPVLVEPGSKLEKVKPGSIEDVSAVGNRDIGKRGMGNWYSTDSEIRMGRQYAAEIEKSTKFITDPVVTEYVNRIGQNIVKNSDCKVPFTIKVIDTDEINAMALPGGFFYVNSGLILNADEEAELAGVMAHETAHVCAHHAARQMTRANYAQLGTIPLIFIGGWTGYGIYEAASIAVPVTFLHFSREFEAEADYLGVQYMYRAGYDPQAYISFFEKVQALEKRKPGLVAKAFSDHPQTPDRIEHSQEEIAHILPAKDEYTVTTSEFDDIKARLARIENKRRLNDNKDGKKPSLRKASSSKDDSTAQSNDPNANPTDQPTLHRREDSN
ncbi:MAG TPA: M48 family metalloprotease [Acidobacteriaceae bacterium]|jgi:predicted Zn-dependent protease|nr:M48 family metalloprotease [Acidobacteriaceae bacterium]